MRHHLVWIIAVLLIASSALAVRDVSAQQYFGRNKVQYRTFKFEVLKTEHFDVYYYDSEQVAAAQAGRMAERWYKRLAKVFNHELTGRQPLILYASHPEFEQTNVIEGQLDESTGGVTEALKRRIVLPLAGPLAETDHVIGHELVHAFQYDITRAGRGGVGFTEPAASHLPLWFIEGMAEYLSIGPRDAHTAMWIRDAAENKKMPTISKLNDPRYFPYRYGEALWAYVGGRYGDDVVAGMVKAAGRSGDANLAIKNMLGTTPDSLSIDWLASVRAWSEPVIGSTQPAASFGRAVIVGKEHHGQLNVAPALSPDGNQLVFFSERDLFSIEMFLADANTGQVLRKITKTSIDPHFQSLQFINSTGAWSPDGRRFAFAAVSKGRPVLTVIEIASGRIVTEIPFDDVGEILNPTWSPDGRQVAFSAMVGGFTDLFVVDLGTRKLRRLTDDAFADIQPAWSPDGSTIAFVTDRSTTRLDDLVLGTTQLALIDPASGAIRAVPSFENAKNINPQWSPDGKSLFFVSDHGGISNLHRITLEGGAIAQITDVRTGVSGITALSPAISAARSVDRVVFGAYEKASFSLYLIDSAEKLAGHDPDVAVAGIDPALLPPSERKSPEGLAVASDPSLGLPPTTTFERAKYRSRLSLDYVSQPSLGVAAGRGGVAVGGGTTLYWSDMLGDHNLATLFQANNGGGSFANNFAAIAAYENRRSRWNWGVTGGQIPYVSRQVVLDEGEIGGTPAVRLRDYRFWEIDRQIQGTANYPFNEATRFELAAGYLNIGFKNELETRVYDAFTGALLSDNTQSLNGDSLQSLHLATGSAAWVYDASVFGGTSPVAGQRARLEVSPMLGTLFLNGVLADYRRYFMIFRPVTLAGRLFHYGRYGRDAEDFRLTNLFLGDSYLVRGYDSGSFTADECANGDCPEFNRLAGSRLGAVNAEIRVPLFGPLGIIPSAGFLPIEAAGFYDAGVAWTSDHKASFLGGDRDAVTSYGTALRVNVFGFAIAEFSLVHPNDRPKKGWYWQIGFQPGF